MTAAGVVLVAQVCYGGWAPTEDQEPGEGALPL